LASADRSVCSMKVGGKFARMERVGSDGQISMGF
jgi:hypothetical protein